MAQTHTFRGVARAILTTPDKGTQYVYHRTAVVTHRPDGCIVLDSGGWHTATTKTAMNQASSQDRLGFRVYAKNGDWFVSGHGPDVAFYDGMVIPCAQFPRSTKPKAPTRKPLSLRDEAMAQFVGIAPRID